MNFVGIDFSLNSPAFCVIKEDSCFWGSLTRTERTLESLRKNADKPYHILKDSPNFSLFTIGKDALPEDYAEKERAKIDYFLGAVDAFWSEIEKNVEGDFKVAMEGLSFMSAGNSLIDISMATALIRKKIIDRIGSQNFYVFSPTAIKKFAGKGNFKKDEMYESLVKFPDPEMKLSPFTAVLDINRDKWITKAKQIAKPIDDMVDATFVALLLQEEAKE
jgi:hypothetical protein